MFFHRQQIELRDLFVFRLAENCLEANEEGEQEERQMSNVEFVIALASVGGIVAVIRSLVWLCCGC